MMKRHLPFALIFGVFTVTKVFSVIAYEETFTPEIGINKFFKLRAV